MQEYKFNLSSINKNQEAQFFLQVFTFQKNFKISFHYVVKWYSTKEQPERNKTELRCLLGYYMREPNS